MTTVLPEPVAIFAHSRRKAPPSDGVSIPTRCAAGASVSPISVSAASFRQKNNRRLSNFSGSFQYSSSRYAMPATPG